MKLIQHWFRAGTHPIRHLVNDPSQIVTKKLYNPKHLAVWGVRRQLEVIDMHREYFLPGKVQKGQATLVKFDDEVVEPHIRDDPNETIVEAGLDWYFQ